MTNVEQVQRCGDGQERATQWTWMRSRRRRCFQRFPQEQGLRSCVLVLREEGSSSFRLTTTRDSRRVRRRATAKGEATRVQGQVLQVWQDGVTCRRIAGSKESSAFEAGEEGLARDRMHRNAAVTVFAEDGGGRLPDAPNARQSKELQGRRQASFCRLLVGERCRSSSKMGLSGT